VKDYKNYDWLHEKYVIQDLEVWEIAREGQTSVKMIHEWLLRFKFYSMDEDAFVDPLEK
jgi:hypothetical protein